MRFTQSAITKQPLPVWLLVLCALAFHGPLLAARVPVQTFDAWFHMSMASHYAHHWFNPWNEKSFAGFSQTTYPPLLHQWIAVLSYIVGLQYGYMIVQGTALLLLPVAVYRFALLWTNPRAASYAGFCSIFLGSLCVLVYQDGQIATTSSTTLFLLALPLFYRYIVSGARRDLALGVATACTAAAAHHATLIFGMFFFVAPTIWIGIQDYSDLHRTASKLVPIRRAALFYGLALVAITIMLLPYVLSVLKYPISEVPIPHTSRANYILSPIWGLHYWLIPFGPAALALPYIFFKGAERRLRPLLAGFYMAFLFGLGGTTPVPRLLLGRAFEVLTFERFTLWSLILATPFLGMLAEELINRYGLIAANLIAFAFIGSGSFAVAWNTFFPLIGAPSDVGPVIQFLNENGRDRYRYLTLGFPNGISKITCYTHASSVDGEYNSARMLPELTNYSVAQLTTAKFYGAEGIAALSSMLKHAPRYGLRYIFVHDSYYDPLLAFTGWRQIASLSHGETTVWSRMGISPATPIASALKPPLWQGILWGTLPFGSSLLTLLLAFLFRNKGEPAWATHGHLTESKASMEAPRVSIILPAYNEARRIPKTMDNILAYLGNSSWSAELIVVDDGSTDDTAEVVTRFAERHGNVRLVQNRRNRGKGKAIRDGVFHAVGEVILFADADDSTPIADAEKLLQAIAGGADIAIGSRWVDRTLQIAPQPWRRRLNGRLYNLLLRGILGLRFKDTQNGFKAYRGGAAKMIFGLQKIEGWGFDAEVLFLARRFGLKVCEVPVEYTYYAEGSKIRPYRDGVRMILELLKVRWYGLSGKYPKASAGLDRSAAETYCSQDTAV